MKRNLVKRTLSLVLSVSVLFSMMIFSSSVSANTATPIFSEDFTTWTAENFAEKLAAGGWSGENNGAALSADANLKTNYNGHTTTNYVVGDNNIFKTTFADTPVTTGKYEVKIKFNPGKEPNANIYLGGSEPIFSKWNSISSNDYLFGANFRWNGFSKDETGASITKDNTGSAFTVGENSMRSNHWRDNAGVFKYNTWYDLSVKADFDTRLVYMALYEEGVTAPVAEHRYVMSENAALGTIMFTNNNNPFAVETIAVTPVTEAVTELANETFDDATIIKDWDLNVKNGYKSLMSSYWTLEKGSRDSHIMDKISSDGSTDFHFDTTTFAGDAEHKNALGFKGYAVNMQYDLVNPISSGRVEISWDYYDVNGSAKPLVAITEGDTAGDDYAMLLSSQSNEFYPFHRPGLGYPILGEVAGKWYTVTVVADLDNDTQDLTVSRGNKQIFKIVDQPLLKEDSKVAPTQIDAIRILNWSGTNPFYIDNFKINVLPGEKEIVEYVTVYEDDFQDSASIDDVFANGWTAKTKDAAGFVTEDGNNYIKITGYTDTIGGLNKDFAYDKTIGKYRFTFDAKVGPIAKGIYAFVDLNSWNEIGVLVNIGQKEIGHTNHNVDNGSEILGDATPGEWIRVETVVDMSKKQVVYTLKNPTNDKIINSYTYNGFNSMDKQLMDGARSFKMMSYKNDTSDDNSVCVDNIKIEYGYASPSISADGVKLADYSGAVIEGINEITPGVKTITLDFGDAVTKESADANITLTGIGENNENDTVTFTSAVDGSKYIITLSDVLLPKATYVLSVGKDVANARGLKLGKDFTYNFTTGVAEFYVQADGVYTGATKYTALAEIKTAEVSEVTVKANTKNLTGEGEPVSIVVVYFNGNMMVDTDVLTATAETGEGVITKPVTLPADMTNITTMKVMFWNDTVNLMPYCGAIEL